MNLTEPYTTIQINKNSRNIPMIRENFKNRSVVKVRDRANGLIASYRFKNVDLPYVSQYLNWQNLDCCGGWDYSEEDLINQFIENKKPFASVMLYLYKDRDVYLLPLIDKCRTMDEVTVIENKHPNDRFRAFALIRKGCLSDYIDIDKVVECYYELGLSKLSERELNYLKAMANEEMISLVKGDNKFNYSYINPTDFIQWIFNGLFLGYPIESTASILGL